MIYCAACGIKCDGAVCCDECLSEYPDLRGKSRHEVYLWIYERWHCIASPPDIYPGQIMRELVVMRLRRLRGKGKEIDREIAMDVSAAFGVSTERAGTLLKRALAP